MSGAPTVRARRAGPRTLPRAKLVSAVLGVALIAVAAMGYQLSQPVDDFQVRNAPLGRFVAYNDGQLQVSDVRVGTRLTRNDESVRTPGIFVVADVTVRAPGRDDVTVSHVQLLSRGPTYTASTIFSTVTARAGFEATAEFTFEVDPAQMDDLTLELWTSGGVVGYHQRTRTHLGITAANAAEWTAAAQGQSIPVSTDATTRALP